ncbi:hypothetical protein G9A89_011323 [Geosiphon pyriformis]|nr:hypothetical protein G9A89_011323 [Geosiphon pyriformis]
MASQNPEGYINLAEVTSDDMGGRNSIPEQPSENLEAQEAAEEERQEEPNLLKDLAGLQLQKLTIGQKLHEASAIIRNLKEENSHLETRLLVIEQEKEQSLEIANKISLLEQNLAEAQNEARSYKEKYTGAQEKAIYLESTLQAQRQTVQQKEINYEREKLELQEIRIRSEQERNQWTNEKTAFETDRHQYEVKIRKLENEHGDLQAKLLQLESKQVMTNSELQSVHVQEQRYRVQYEKIVEEMKTKDQRHQLEMGKLQNQIYTLEDENRTYLRERQKDHTRINELLQSEDEYKKILSQQTQDLGTLEQELNVKEAQCIELETKVSEMRKSLEDTEKMAVVAMESPNTAGLIALGNHGKSLPDLLREHRSMSIELNQLRNIAMDYRKLQDTMKKVCDEVVQHGPIMQARNEESKRKSHEIDRLTRELKLKNDRLARLSYDLQLNQSRCQSLEEELNRANTENHVLLEHNVYFLKELEDRPSIGIHTSVRVSSENSIGFRDISEMYSQNVSMTSDLTGLTRRVQELEGKNRDLEGFAEENIRLYTEIELLKKRLEVRSPMSQNPEVSMNFATTPDVAYYKKEIDSLQSRVNELMNSREQLTGDCNNLRQQLNEAMSLNSKHQIAEHQLEVYKQWLDSEKERAKKLEEEHGKILELRSVEIKDLRGQLEALREESIPIKTQLNERTTSLSQLMSTHSNLQKQHQEVLANWQKEMEAVKSIEKEAAKLSNEKQNLSRELHTHKSNLEVINTQLTATLAQLKESTDERSLLGQKLGTLHTELETLGVEKVQIQTELESKIKEINEIKDQLKSYETNDSHLTISQLRESLTEARNRYRRLQDQIDYLQNLSQDSQCVVEALDIKNNEYQEKTEQMSKKLLQLRMELEKINLDLNQTQVERDSVQKQLVAVRESAEINIQQLRTSEEYLKTQVQQKNKDLAESKARFDSQVIDLADALRKHSDMEKNYKNLLAEYEDLKSRTESVVADLNNEKNVLEGQLHNLGEKYEKLQEANEIYQKQAESDAPPELNVAIQGLRWQLEEFTKENTELKQKNESYRHDLDETRKQVERWRELYEQEHQKLEISGYGEALAKAQSQTEQANVHNRLLHEENQRLNKNLKESEARMDQAESKYRALSTQLSRVESEKQHFKETYERTLKDYETEQQRHTAIIASRADITPAEVEKLRKTEENLKNQMKSISDQHKKEASQIKGQLRTKITETENLKKELIKLKQEKDAEKAKAESESQQREKVESQANDMRKRAKQAIEKFKNESTKLREENATLKQNKESLESLQKENETLKEENINLKQEVERMKKQVEEQVKTAALRLSVLESQLANTQNKHEKELSQLKALVEEQNKAPAQTPEEPTTTAPVPTTSSVTQPEIQAELNAEPKSTETTINASPKDLTPRVPSATVQSPEPIVSSVLTAVIMPITPLPPAASTPPAATSQSISLIDLAASASLFAPSNNQKEKPPVKLNRTRLFPISHVPSETPNNTPPIPVPVPAPVPAPSTQLPNLSGTTATSFDKPSLSGSLGSMTNSGTSVNLDSPNLEASETQSSEPDRKRRRSLGDEDGREGSDPYPQNQEVKTTVYEGVSSDNTGTIEVPEENEDKNPPAISDDLPTVKRIKLDAPRTDTEENEKE